MGGVSNGMRQEGCLGEPEKFLIIGGRCLSLYLVVQVAPLAKPGGVIIVFVHGIPMKMGRSLSHENKNCVGINAPAYHYINWYTYI